MAGGWNKESACPVTYREAEKRAVEGNGVHGLLPFMGVSEHALLKRGAWESHSFPHNLFLFQTIACSEKNFPPPLRKP
jgi:hypothetical protein